jgi:hemolysin activation/secretion protein
MGALVSLTQAAGDVWAQDHTTVSDANASAPARLDIFEYYVSGNSVLEPEVIAQACAPFLGPGRTPDDVDQARAALEAVYRERGYRTVGVSIPQQTVRDGVVRLEVVESKVGHLTVQGSKFHSIERIKAQVPSLTEGAVPNFTEVERDIVAVNQQPDRRVTPALKAGAAPGTVDVDLVVDDNLPLHGSLEVSNRKSQDTSALRALASLSYDNLWQRGHSLSLSGQVAPENRDDALVFYGSYLARFSNSPFSVLLSALRSDSDVSTVGGTNVVGNGTVIGLRGVWAFPASETFYSSLSFGLDYKHFKNDVTLGEDTIKTPVEYYPFAVGYTGLLRSARATTQIDVGTRFAFSGLGSDSEVFGDNRAYARGQQFSLRASVNHTHELFAGFRGRFRVGGQITDQPLISNEQFSAGGLDSVRGYLESEALGDSGWDASVELRSPSLLGNIEFIDDLQLYGFVDGAHMRLRQTLPDQQAAYSLGSTGLGLDVHLGHLLNGAFVWAYPFKDGPTTESGDSRWLFRMWTDF